jgi:hypothetical protein
MWLGIETNGCCIWRHGHRWTFWIKMQGTPMKSLTGG